MRAVTSISLAILFVLLAGFNVWNKLSRRGASSRGARVWVEVHRVAGSIFILLFAVFCYFMALRIRGLPDELSPRLILHAGLAMVLVPVLLAKVMAARYQKASRGLLSALGIMIFGISFTLVALNVAVHFLRDASRGRVPATVSGALGFVLLCLIGIGISPRRVRAGRQVPALSEPAAGFVPSGRNSATNPLTLTLARVEPQTHDAKTLRFLLPKGVNLGARPGQFLTFEWVIGDKEVSRCYSICSSPAQSAYVEITPKRVKNGLASTFLNQEAAPGFTIRCRGPYGKFCFDEDKHRRLALLVAGSGITPILAMLRYIDDLCLRVDCTLIYCNRNENEILFLSELAALQQRLERFRYTLVLSQPRSDWEGWKGRLRREILEHEIHAPLDCTYFLCGPPGFMELGRSLLSDISVDPANVLQESFGGAVTGAASPVADPSDTKITYSRSGVSCGLIAGKTLLESAEANGILIPSGCRQGSCGTCATRLISGNVEMNQPEALTEELRTNGYILPCVSRALGNVVLDA